MNIDDKYSFLKETINKKGTPLVAFSGGVDSSLITVIAFEIFGENMLAVTLKSPTTPSNEYESALELAKQFGFPHEVIEHNELDCSDLTANPRNRCYYCKKLMATHLKKIASERGYDVVLEGTSKGELTGHRPGYQALQEEGVSSPLVDCGFDKEEIRILAKKLDLPNHMMPSTACLSSRIPTGVEIQAETLKLIDEAEKYLRNLGFTQVRVRLDGDNARIEVNEGKIQELKKNMTIVSEKLKKIGFNRISVDPTGYKTS